MSDSREPDEEETPDQGRNGFESKGAKKYREHVNTIKLTKQKALLAARKE